MVPNTGLCVLQGFVEQVKYVRACTVHIRGHCNLFAYSLKGIKATFKKCLQ